MNNKMIKGSIAGATGIVLLMGGFGTYALWSDSVPADGGVLGSGVLDIVGAADGIWSDVSAGDPGSTIDDIDAFSMVPGDVVKLTQPLDVQATGTNLQAELVVSGVTSSFTALEVDGEYGGQSADNWVPNGAGDYVLSYANADLAALNGDTEATVTFTLPSSVSEQTDQSASIDLSNVTVTLRQVR